MTGPGSYRRLLLLTRKLDEELQRGMFTAIISWFSARRLDDQWHRQLPGSSGGRMWGCVPGWAA